MHVRLKPILFFSVVFAIAGYLVFHGVGDSSTLEVGKPAPDFSVRDQSGNELRLSDLRGNVVFLNFWATNCAPCEAEMPDMEIVSQIFKGRPFRMVAISIDLDWGPVSSFYKRYGITLPTYLDPGRKVFNAYRLTGTPETFIIDGEGILQRVYIGQQRWTSPQMIASFEAVIKLQTVPEGSD